MRDKKVMPSSEELIERIVAWKRERPILDAQNKQMFASGEIYAKDGLFVGEVDEFRVAVAETLTEKGKDVDVASELADILFLCVSNIDSQGLDPQPFLTKELLVDKSLEQTSPQELQTVWIQSVLFLLREVDNLPTKEEFELIQSMITIARHSTTALYAYGFDPLLAVEGKLLRNEAKYPARLFQAGVYQDAAKQAKKDWEPRKASENERYVGPARLRTGELIEE